MFGWTSIAEMVVEATMQERQRELEKRLQRQAVLDYLRDTGSSAGSPGTLRLSAHWLGVRLERLGTALQAPAVREQELEEVAVQIHRGR